MQLAPNIPRFRLSAEQVLEMVRQGILREETPVELIGGELVAVTPQGPVHRSLSALLHRRLDRAYGDGYHVQSHSTIRAGEHSLPEPDVAVVRGHPFDYRDRLPDGSDVVLVIEVSVTSQAFDLQKASLYADAEVTQYWLIDLPRRRVHLHGRPEGGQYADVRLLAEGDDLQLPELDLIWSVSRLLPPQSE